MKKIILIALLLLGLQLIQAQEFKKSYSSQVPPHNGYYFKGKLMVSATNDNGTIYTGNDSSRNLNVTKLNASGCVEWSYSYDFGDDATGSMVKQLADGGYLIGGNLMQNSGNDKDLILKITNSGTVVWSRLLNDAEFVTDCVQSGNTLAIVTGQTGDTSETSILEVDEITGTITSINRIARTPVDGNDTYINAHFNRILAAPSGGYYLAGNVQYSASPYRRAALVYVNATANIQSFFVFSSGSSIDEMIAQPFGALLIAIENQDNAYSGVFPNSNSRITLIKMDDSGFMYWKKFYSPTIAGNNLAQNYPNSIVETNNGNLLICGIADQADGSLNYIFKTDSYGNVIGDMHKISAPWNSGITSMSRTTSNDFVATLNSRGMIRFTDNLDNLCDATNYPYGSNNDTVTQIASETGTINAIADASVVANPTRYMATENVTMLCGTATCPTLQCYGSNSSLGNLTTGLLAYYPFGGGSISDYSGNGHHLANTTTAHMAADRNGHADCAFEFDNLPGTNNEFLSTANTAFLNGLTEYSVSLWYKALDTSRGIVDYETLVGRDYRPITCPDRTGQWTLGLYDLRNATFGRQSSVWQVGSNSVVANTGSWHHLTATYNHVGETLKLYRDGVLQMTSNGIVNCGIQGNTVQDIGDLFVGKGYTGILDDIFIHNRELSLTEINQLYNLGSSCCSGGPIAAADDAYGPIDGNTGGTTASVMVNDTLNGNPVTVSQVNITLVSSTNSNLSIDAAGVITVASGTAAGTYTITYKICEAADSSNCDTALATVVVTVPVVCWDRFSLGGGHTLAIKTDGTLWAWGQNYYGQLGIGNNTNTNSPVQVGTDTDWKYIYAGTYLNHAIKNNGTLWAWGDNSAGQFGNGTTTDSNIPVQIGTDTDWKMTSIGRDYTLALKNSNTLWATGGNLFGQLGDGTNTSKTSFVQIGNNTDWQSCRAGTNFCSMARKANGTIYSWGLNDASQLGDGTTINRNTPALLDTSIWQAPYASGFRFGLAMRSGKIYSWGDNTYGSLGNGNNTNEVMPVAINSDTDWVYTDSGYYYGLAKKNDGTLWTWGYNSFGALGNGTFVDSNTPGLVNNDTDWDVIYSTMHHIIAKKTDGTFWTWGWNQSGQLGDGTNVNKNVPTLLSCGPTLSNHQAAGTSIFSMFPNPASHSITINATDKISKVEVNDVNGRTVLISSNDTNSMNLNIEKLAAGIYMVKVSTGKATSAQKFIKI